MFVMTCCLILFSTGDLFDVREFHDVVLECGQVPMPVLRGVVDRYIKERLQRGTDNK